MKSPIRITMAFAIVATMAVSAFASLSQQYVDFGNGPAQWLMTKDEQSKWKSIRNDADAQAFIDLFWARRDPTPATPVNEFREAFDARVKLANERFTTGKKPGSMTELGHVLVVLGPPTKIAKSDPNDMISKQPGAGSLGDDSSSSDAVSTTAARQLWTWDRAKTTLPFDGPNFEIGFTDQFADGRWQISRGKFDVSGMLNKMVNAAIVNPNLTEAPKYGQPQKAAAVAPVPVVVGLPALKTPALQAAVDAEKGGTSTLPKTGKVVSAQFISPSGEFYVPVGILVPKSANIAPEAVDTLFGLIAGADGSVVSSFEEPTNVFNSNGDLLGSESLSLPSGKYTAYVGLAKAGVPVAIATGPLEVNALAKDATGTSPMLFVKTYEETPTAAPEKAPFAFGAIKLIPNADLKLSNQDIVSFFVEMHNPGIDPATNGPKIQSKFELSGGKLKAPMTTPLAEEPVAPLSGKPGAGEYAVLGRGIIPLAQIKPALPAGDYKLKVKLIDTIAKQSYTLEQNFKIE